MADLDRLPLDIQQSDRCVVWNREMRDGKPTKVPYCAVRPSEHAAVDDPTTWSPFDAARGAYEDGKADGVGVVLGEGLVGVDIDKCRDPETGEITAEAMAIITGLDSYTEKSPSGTGVHVLVRGELPTGRRRKGPIEMYSEGRYFTLTGDHLPGTPTAIEERTDALRALHARIFEKPAPKPSPGPVSVSLDDATLIARASLARNGPTFARLWAGDTSDYQSHSEADQALCNRLAFWTGRDAGRMDALMRQSGLMREKWDSRRGTTTYGQQTIDTAISACHQTYSPVVARERAREQADDPLDLTDLSTLMAEADDAIDFLVEARFAYGSVNLLAGRPKAGKSTLARALALAVARGERWLGHRCLPGRVVYLALEDKRSEVRRHLRAMGATGEEPIRFLIGGAPRDLLAKLAALVAAGDTIDLLLIDTAQRLLTVRDTNDYALVTAAFEPVLALARTHGTCIVLLHHAGKADRAGIEAILGSTAWAGSVDNVVMLNRTERYRLVSSIQRIGPDLDETVVLMDEHTGDVRMGGSRYLVDIATVKQAMLDVLAGAGESGIRRDDLLADVEARRELKLKALKDLTTDPAVERFGAGTKIDPYRFRLVREPPSAEGTDSDSGSQVPLRGWEPESRSQVPSTPIAVNSGSRGSTGSRGSREVSRVRV